MRANKSSASGNQDPHIGLPSNRVRILVELRESSRNSQHSKANRNGKDLTWKNLAFLKGDGVGGGFVDPLEASLAITQILP